jgi:mannose-6-phosphate isomerase-like protein (cupin superfamily)
VAEYTLKNLRALEDIAPSHGMEGVAARFAAKELEMREAGLSLQRLEPGVRFPFGHSHGRQEEVYVIVSGSGRVKLDDEIAEVAQWDAIRVPGSVMRAFEAGDDGLEYLAFGAPRDPDAPPGGGDAEVVPGWWSD